MRKQNENNKPKKKTQTHLLTRKMKNTVACETFHAKMKRNKLCLIVIVKLCESPGRICRSYEMESQRKKPINIFLDKRKAYEIRFGPDKIHAFSFGREEILPRN